MAVAMHQHQLHATLFDIQNHKEKLNSNYLAVGNNRMLKRLGGKTW